MKTKVSALLVSASLLTAPAVFAQATVDENLPVYEKTSGVSGNLSSVGSDTLANLMTLWAESFKRTYPNVNVQIQAAGSSTAPPALAENTSNLGPMSRLMKDKEIESFEKKFGYKPTPIAVAIDSEDAFRVNIVLAGWWWFGFSWCVVHAMGCDVFCLCVMLSYA